jgi:hypothetical protein
MYADDIIYIPATPRRGSIGVGNGNGGNNPTPKKAKKKFNNNNMHECDFKSLECVFNTNKE